MGLNRGSLLLFLAAALAAQTIDRIAVVVGKTVYTESEVLDSLRLTEFLNSEPLDVSPARRRAAAERMVDQELLRNEMKLSRFPTPPPAQADTLVREFVQQHYRGNSAAFRAALEKYEITEDQLKQALLWQVTLLRFTDQRFRPELAPPATQQSANRLRPGAAIPASDAAHSVDQQMEQWLQDARKGTRVVFKPEAFQ